MDYPPCPNCGGELPFDEFYRRVGVQNWMNLFLDMLDRSRRRRRGWRPDHDMPTEFSLTCGKCGAKSAVDNTHQRPIHVALVLAAAALFGFLVLAGLSTGWSIAIGVAALLFSAPFVPTTMTLRVTSMRDDETPARRLARADRDMSEEVERLDPYSTQHLPDPEPVPLDPGLSDIAARIDAAYKESAPAAPERPEYELAEERELERAKVACDKCGKLNQRDFEQCWNCDAVLPVRASSVSL